VWQERRHASTELENLKSPNDVIPKATRRGCSIHRARRSAIALATLGFNGIGEVRQGKLIELDLAETDPARAREQAEAMCKELLANPVIEDYSIQIGSSA
jgi:phosphoribosylformylglycinamidine synthase